MIYSKKQTTKIKNNLSLFIIGILFTSLFALSFAVAQQGVAIGSSLNVEGIKVNPSPTIESSSNFNENDIEDVTDNSGKDDLSSKRNRKLIGDIEDDVDKIIFPGDVNDDGKVDTADLVMLTQYITKKIGNVPNLRAVDFNGDGKNNWADAVGLANYLHLNPGNVLLGDVNYDGKVDISDSILLMDYLKGEFVMIKLVNADFNQDGLINSDDWRNILEYLFRNDPDKKIKIDQFNERNNSKKNSEIRVGSLTSGDVADKFGFDPDDIGEELERVREYKPSETSYDFPIITINGYGDEIKFILFKKQSSEINGDSVNIVSTIYSGSIGTSDGKYEVRGTNVISLDLIRKDEVVGKVNFNFNENVATLNLNNGFVESYVLSEVNRESVKSNSNKYDVVKVIPEDSSLGSKNPDYSGKTGNIGFWKKVRNLFIKS